MAESNRTMQTKPPAQPLDESLGYLLRSAHRTFARALAEELAPHGILTTEWAALRVLWRETALTQVELADRMRIERASLTGVLAGLEKKSLLLRGRSTDDRRKIHLRLTPAGRAMECRLMPCGWAVNARATRGVLPAEIRQVRATLIRLMRNFSA